MELTTAEQVILERFYQKCRMTGGPRAGYVLRKRAITVLGDDRPELDLEGGLASLVDKGLLMVSESGSFFFLSESGSEALAELHG